MTELLAPAGNMESLKAAIANGCDAVYLGMQKFGARAYSDNFDINALREAVKYAHLRAVKVYVTMNTIVFEEEIEDMHEQLRRLNEIGVDGIIVQDLAVLNFAGQSFEDMEVHCSTQMGIDDLDGALLCRELGCDRVVPARELGIDKIRDIKRKSGLAVEVFIHGALCISYSGNCLMSGLIGYRSGNRGRCVGSCRKLYELIDSSDKKSVKSIGKGYLLSTKDLNTIDNIDELREIDSLKIEGRMKEPVYVANVVSKYRAALDGKASAEDGKDLKKTFNRTYTKGYMFGEAAENIVNTERPNNFGYPIGRISGFFKGMYEISLEEALNQNDIIRIAHGGEDVNLSVVKLYDRSGNLINRAEDVCRIKIKERLSKGDIVYKTRDNLYYKRLENMLEGEYRRFPLDIMVYACPGSALVITAEGFGMSCVYEGDEALSEAVNSPTTREQVVKQFSKLNDTVFTLGEVTYEQYNAFVPVKMLNTARRQIVQTLYEMKLADVKRRTREPVLEQKITFPQVKPYITASVMTREQYEECRKLGIENIYFENIIRRNQTEYEPKSGELLIGGYGGIYHYRSTNEFVTDYSLNVVNSDSCYQLYRQGAKRVTLSYELNKRQIKELISAYRETNGGYPALEMIVYGRAPLLFTKYCPLKNMKLCGKCKTGSYEMRDEYGSFPLISHEDCSTTILNGRILNLLDEMPSIQGIEAFRLSFTTENADEVRRVVTEALKKLDGSSDKTLFNSKTDTRGHFNREIM